MGTVRLTAGRWRARVDDGFDDETVMRLASALGDIWACRQEGQQVMVGYDGRRDSRRLAQLAGETIAAYGLRVIVSDRVCPTPALGWAIAHEPSCVGGVMLTASRMPHEYGGVLVRQADGGPIDSAMGAQLTQRIQLARGVRRAPVERADLVTAYVDALAAGADTALIEASGLRVVADPLYAAGAGVASELFERLGCKVVRLHDRVVPDFRGLHPDAREPWVDECERVVVAQGAGLGVVLDGDCGRLAVVDCDGRLVSPHNLAPLVLEHLVCQRGMRGRVVGTVATSARLARQAQRLGCEYTMVAVGREALHRELAMGDVLLAADESGGICIPSHAGVRDAILAATMLLELCAGTAESMRGLVDRMEGDVGHSEYAACDIRLDFGATQRLRNLLPGLNPPDVCGERPVSVSHADGLRLQLADGSWLLLRPSSSGVGARACAEGPTPAKARSLLAAARSLAP